MKQLRRFIWVLCAVACLFSLTACSGGSEESEEIDPVLSQTLVQQTALMLQSIAVSPQEDLNQLIEQDPGSAFAAGLENYISIQGDLGALTSISENGTVALVDDGYEVTMPAQFEKRACDLVIVWSLDGQVLDIVSMTFNPEYTLGENMTKAALNTVMGMGTVFVVLILISLLIGCFKYINVFEKKMQEKKPAPAPAAAPAPAPVPVPAAAEEEEAGDDLELAAVITAAIAAASESVPADGLVVRSIRRVSGSNKWKNA